MQFLNRTAELQRLRRLLEQKRGGLAVVWGRRRVGKTRLLIEWARKTGGCYFVADESAATVQRAFFARALETCFPDFARVEYRDWPSLFARIASEAKAAEWRGPLIIDELPYLVQASPELPSVLQRWVDHEAKDARLTVALAGSSQRMMHGIVLDPSAPLYGRASVVMHLGPLAAGHILEALRVRSPTEAVQHYTAWGGIPRYWELAAESSGTIDDRLDELVLDPLGPLHLEPDRLLREEMPPALALRPVLDVIGQGAHRLSEIAGRVGQPATSLARPMSRLVEMELVYREIPFGESEKSSRRSLYRVADPFLRLWFRVVAPHRGSLTQGTAATRRFLWAKYRPSLVATAWEELCRASVPRLHEIDPGISPLGPWEPASRAWGGNGPEWDVVARSLDGKQLLLGEVKWSEKPVSHDDIERLARSLMAKGLPSGAQSEGLEVHYAVFVGALAKSRRKWALPAHVLESADVLRSLR